MAENDRPAGEEKTPGVAYERKDLNLRGVVKFGFWLLVAAVVIHLALWWLLKYFAAQESEAGMRTPIGRPRETLPPTPVRREATLPQELKQMRESAQARLRSYGWIDREAGIVHIPIDRAMELLAKRGLPSSPRQGDPQHRHGAERSGTRGKGGSKRAESRGGR